MLPREVKKTSMNCRCSLLRRQKRQASKRPSIVVWQLLQCSLVTAMALPHTGHLVRMGFDNINHHLHKLKLALSLSNSLLHILKPVLNFVNVKMNILKPRSEEHTSELQSRENLVCLLLLEKKT